MIRIKGTEINISDYCIFTKQDDETTLAQYIGEKIYFFTPLGKQIIGNEQIITINGQSTKLYTLIDHINQGLYDEMDLYNNGNSFTYDELKYRLHQIDKNKTRNTTDINLQFIKDGKLEQFELKSIMDKGLCHLVDLYTDKHHTNRLSLKEVIDYYNDETRKDIDTVSVIRDISTREELKTLKIYKQKFFIDYFLNDLKDMNYCKYFNKKIDSDIQEIINSLIERPYDDLKLHCKRDLDEKYVEDFIKTDLFKSDVYDQILKDIVIGTFTSAYGRHCVLYNYYHKPREISLKDLLTNFYNSTKEIKEIDNDLPSFIGLGKKLILFKNMAIGNNFTIEDVLRQTHINFFLPTSTTYDFDFVFNEWHGEIILIIEASTDIDYFIIGGDQMEITLAPGVFNRSELFFCTHLGKKKIMIKGEYTVDDIGETVTNKSVNTLRRIEANLCERREPEQSGGYHEFYKKKYQKYKHKYLTNLNTLNWK